MNIARLVPLSVSLNLRNLLLYLKVFLIFHFVLFCELSFHAKLYRTLWIYQGIHLLPRSRHQEIYICHVLLIEVDEYKNLNYKILSY